MIAADRCPCRGLVVGLPLALAMWWALAEWVVLLASMALLSYVQWGPKPGITCTCETFEGGLVPGPWSSGLRLHAPHADCRCDWTRP
jgi:hypothetical protein